MDLRQPSSRSPHSSPFPLAQVPPDHNPHPNSQNHNSNADEISSTQPLSSQLFYDILNVDPSHFDDTQDNGRRSWFEPDRPESQNHSSGADENKDVNSAQAFSSRSQLLRNTPLDDAESVDFLMYGDTQDGRRSLPRYDIKPLHPPPTARSP